MKMTMMNIDDQNQEFRLAFQMATETDRTIYLTGKAGTGKTTFLKYLRAHCTKKMVVAAPTGVAAINAGGVTLHSLFQLPFGPYIPSVQKGFGLNEHVIDRNQLLKNLKIQGKKKKLLQEIELLIIDEVSMLRCDTLDAIHHILQFVRRNHLPFGGVQVLFIGDLFQLPPVVNDKDKKLLDDEYGNPFFFQAHVLKDQPLVYIELTKIYRQNEQGFINILNRTRQGHLEEDDYTLLQARYFPSFQDDGNKYITLTTHNHRADTINRQELQRINSPSFEFTASIEGDFFENQYPTEKVLTLKKGAQVMFIRNDSSPEKRFYNGKIAIVHDVNQDEILVEFPESGILFTVEKETWENIAYRHNETNNEIEEKVLGRFTQYPLRLAWAITIHKSQGLTFDYAIIDAGDSFAPGQVYVALSRCTSMEGIVLKSPITSKALHLDERIHHFSEMQPSLRQLEQELDHSKLSFQCKQLLSLFNWSALHESLSAYEVAIIAHKFETPDNKLLLQVQAARILLGELDSTAARFNVELQSLLNGVQYQSDTSNLFERMPKAVQYFCDRLHDNMLIPFQTYFNELPTKTKTKKFQLAFQQIESALWHKIDELQHASFLGSDFFNEAQRRSKPAIAPFKKKTKGESAKESLVYFMAGKTIAEIAAIRNYAVSTIEGHLAHYVTNGELEIQRFMSDNQLAIIQQALQTIKTEDSGKLTILKSMLGDEFTYGQLRLAVAHFTGK